MPNERTKFRKWIASLPVDKDVAKMLLRHLPDDASLDSEAPYQISSPSGVIGLNGNCYGLPQDPVDDGFLIIGECLNGDPVAVSFRDPQLPVFYINHEEMHSEPLLNVIRKVSNSIDAYHQSLSDERSSVPVDYWHAQKS